MILISEKLYSKIPLVDRLDSLSMDNLIKVAWKDYGVSYRPNEHYDKSDIIDDILRSIKDVGELKKRV